MRDFTVIIVIMSDVGQWPWIRFAGAKRKRLRLRRVENKRGGFIFD